MKGDTKMSKAKDEGGPTHQLLSDLWDHLSVIEIKGKTLFTRDGSGTCSPAIDGQLEFSLKPSEVTAQRVCEMVGRAILFCVVNLITMPETILPRLYQQFILRGVEPIDGDYPLAELLHDVEQILPWKRAERNHDNNEKASRPREEYLTQLSMDATRLDEWMAEAEADDSRSNSENQCMLRARIQEFAITPRRRLLGFIRAGFTAHGTCALKGLLYWHYASILSSDKLLGIQTYLRGHPYRIVREVYFASPVISAEDLISILRLPPDGHYGNEHLRGGYNQRFGHESVALQKRVLSIGRDNERSGTLPSLLRNQTDLFRSKFLVYVTGSKIIQSDERFRITVEFDDEMTQEDHPPIVHTCSKDIRFPSHAYEGSEEMLEKMMTLAMNQMAGGFDRE